MSCAGGVIRICRPKPKALNVPGKYLNKILNARVYDVATESPLEEAKSLSAH